MHANCTELVAKRSLRGGTNCLAHDSSTKSLTDDAAEWSGTLQEHACLADSNCNLHAGVYSKPLIPGSVSDASMQHVFHTQQFRDVDGGCCQLP
jgi:hypothetical protein